MMSSCSAVAGRGGGSPRGRAGGTDTCETSGAEKPARWETRFSAGGGGGSAAAGAGGDRSVRAAAAGRGGGARGARKRPKGGRWSGQPCSVGARSPPTPPGTAGPRQPGA